MKSKPLNLFNIAIINIRAKSFRSAAIIFIVAIFSFSMFAGAILTKSMSIGLETAGKRLGADIAIIPAGYESGYTDIILSGEPVNFYFDKSIEDYVSGIRGVEKVTGQFFLTTLPADCCALPVQIIAIDPETDFVTMPWISKVYKGALGDGQLVIGNDIILSRSESSLMFFGKDFEVAARLEKSSTGMDNSIFVTKNTAGEMQALAEEIIAANESDITCNINDGPVGNVNDSLSTVLVKVRDGYEIGKVLLDIRLDLPEVSAVRSKDVFVSLSNKQAAINHMTSASFAAVWILAIAILSIIYAFSINVRKKEFATLRLLGATKKWVIQSVTAEAFLISIAGGGIGLLLASIVIFPFSAYIGSRLELPFILPDIGAILTYFTVSLLISLIAGTLSATILAFKISGAETYLTIREGE